MFNEKDIQDKLNKLALEKVENLYQENIDKEFNEVEEVKIIESEGLRASLAQQIAAVKSSISAAKERGDESAVSQLESKLNELRSKRNMQTEDVLEENTEFPVGSKVIHTYNTRGREGKFDVGTVVDHSNRGIHVKWPRKRSDMVHSARELVHAQEHHINPKPQTNDDVAKIRHANPNSTVHDIGTKVTHKNTSLGKHHLNGVVGTVQRVEDHGAGMIAHYVRWPNKRSNSHHWGSWLQPVEHEEFEDINEVFGDSGYIPHGYRVRFKHKQSGQEGYGHVVDKNGEDYTIRTDDGKHYYSHRKDMIPVPKDHMDAKKLKHLNGISEEEFEDINEAKTDDEAHKVVSNRIGHLGKLEKVRKYRDGGKTYHAFKLHTDDGIETHVAVNSGKNGWVVNKTHTQPLQEELKVGDKVIVRPPSYPHMKWEGKIVRKSKHGDDFHRVEYEYDGMGGGKSKHIDTFHKKHLTKIEEEVVKSETTKDGITIDHHHNGIKHVSSISDVDGEYYSHKYDGHTKNEMLDHFRNHVLPKGKKKVAESDKTLWDEKKDKWLEKFTKDQKNKKEKKSDVKEDEQLDEVEKVYDPLTKKNVKTKTMKQKMGGGWRKTDPHTGVVIDSSDKNEIGKKVTEADNPAPFGRHGDGSIVKRYGIYSKNTGRLVASHENDFDAKKIAKRKQKSLNQDMEVKDHGYHVWESEQLTESARHYVYKHWPDLHQFVQVGKRGGYASREEAEKHAEKFNSNKDEHEIPHHYKAMSIGVVKEDEQQLDEISKKTLGSYVKKAHDQIEKHSRTAFSQNTFKWGDTEKRKRKNRQEGLNKAVDKLTKESTKLDEEVSFDDYKKKVKSLGYTMSTKHYSDFSGVSKYKHKEHGEFNASSSIHTKDSLEKHKELNALRQEHKGKVFDGMRRVIV